ncbi:MAG: phasin [Rhizobiales bacterium PAR1]|nr:MAG: phasin [Rhizobiales bacterium PAR1]
MIKPDGKFQVPDDMRNLLEQGVTQAREGFGKVMSAAGEAVSALEQKSDTAQEKAAELRRKSISFTESSMAAAFDLAQKLVSAKSLDEVMKHQSEYMAKQFASVRDHVQEAGADIQQQAKAAAENFAAEAAKMQAKAKDALAEGAATARKAAAAVDSVTKGKK